MQPLHNQSISAVDALRFNHGDTCLTYDFELSGDDNGDGIPDTCDVGPTAGEDFDLNGIIDSSACDTATGPPTSADQCKNGGYKKFNSPTFKNQGQCVSAINSNRGGNQQHDPLWRRQAKGLSVYVLRAPSLVSHVPARAHISGVWPVSAAIMT